MNRVNSIFKKLSSGKMIAGALLVAGIMVFSTASVANAAPSYFDVPKPSSPAQCNGHTTTYNWEWQWERNNQGPWWTWFWFGHWAKVEHKTPNWQKLGFSSKDQCIRYTSTAAPQSRKDCKQGGWYALGFNNQGQCVRYFRINGGGGYGGNNPMLMQEDYAEDEA